MRTLLVMMAAMLSLGAYFSDGRPAPAPEIEAASPTCRGKACKQHTPYFKPRPPGVEWPAPPRGRDVNCKLRVIPLYGTQ